MLNFGSCKVFLTMTWSFKIEKMCLFRIKIVYFMNRAIIIKNQHNLMFEIIILYFYHNYILLFNLKFKILDY